MHMNYYNKNSDSSTVFSKYLFVDLSCQNLRCFCYCCIDSCRILTACLSHVRTAAAATANQCRNSFDQVTCMGCPASLQHLLPL